MEEKVVYLKNGTTMDAKLFDGIWEFAQKVYEMDSIDGETILLEISLLEYNPNLGSSLDTIRVVRAFGFMQDNQIRPEVVEVISLALVEQTKNKYTLVNPMCPYSEIVLRDGSTITLKEAKDLFVLSKLLLERKLLIVLIDSVLGPNSLPDGAIIPTKKLLSFANSFVGQESGDIIVYSPFRGIYVDEPVWGNS